MIPLYGGSSDDETPGSFSFRGIIDVLSLILMIAMIYHFAKRMIRMPSLLVRDLSEQAKHTLAIRAAQHGRSQQAEAKSILEDALVPASGSWITMMRTKAQKAGGIDIPPAQRHVPRITGIVL